MDLPFDPQNQTFFIVGSSHLTNTSDPDSPPLIAISLPVIDAQRVRLASTSINYGVQLGLCLLSLLTSLLLLPSAKLRRPVHLAQVLCLAVSVTRLALLVLYFPGPLTEYYVAWTRDASVLPPAAYDDTTAASALSVLQLALVEASLMLQSRVLVRTWGVYAASSTTTPPSPFPSSSSSSSQPSSTAVGSSPSSSKSAGTGTTSRIRIDQCWWRPAVLFLAVTLAVAAVALRAVWVARYTQALRGHTLPVPLDNVGKASVVTSAMSVFYFCGIFFAHLALHLAATRRVLRGTNGRKMSIALSLGGGSGGGRGARGLTSLEILAVGNGILMLAPCIFAGLDVAAGPGNTRVLPFDAGSWVQTLVAAGLPLISIAAFYRGSDTVTSRFRRSNIGSSSNSGGGGGGGGRRRDRRTDDTNFNNYSHSNNATRPNPSFVTPHPSSPFIHRPHDLSKTNADADVDSETLHSSTYWSPRSPVGAADVDDIEAGNSFARPTSDEVQEKRSSIARRDPEARAESKVKE
ncbi:fungal pheromone mating factor STE2 GPCR-domain-containing protein [Daldinia caldariorum]|uniref:fungal pheromone mating factor STE2 GPCR-domain-containing protein n=1 Tax=Daldinia caldariorum TaxID=326644 RepID=UPI0020080843|nr:fungal pheromone mating factor STE2 GPCR-domain-containing protein [Daldinia caldariorum]KAI1467783.1 fungal pheromone mating factor STE2 GPCR-domain-containing protein [Daldinia caldariorum]